MLTFEQTYSSEMNSQGAHIIDDFDSAIEELATSTIESSDVIQPPKDNYQTDQTILERQNDDRQQSELQVESFNQESALVEEVGGSNK